ncbi:right-handed parallel beta-helix repeat-containing protein [Acinetobacter nosocomialis]|uniref:hypothetical protein n=1 Tax=Acinetobacter nosocomialis TaxID=106654 RepID=UPI0003B2997F|nr:hypothetical protein [Acinetobacter nosocomialis]MDH2635424.1 hypothetical protein [Acinetobacter nosocomialis]OTT94237.1 hypothetical protein CAT69_08860 [Acinetobacter nosocomialis]QCP63068.1 hypothetical protein FDQ49_03705 [Acinetobacter nosocomialis M2]
MNTIVDVVESISELINIQNPVEGKVIYVESYHVGENKGGGYFLFKKNNLEKENLVTVFKTDIGYWCRLEQKLSIYDAGILASNLDYTKNFQDLVNCSKNRINLYGLNIKLKKLDVPSGTEIFNGTLDFSNSTEINTSNFIHNGFIVGSNRSREEDPELENIYNSIPYVENISFHSINFITARNSVSSNIMIFHKIKNLNISNCTAFDMGGSNLIKVIGGMSGTNPNTTGIWDELYPKNGWSENIKIANNKVTGGLLDKNNEGKYIIGTMSRCLACKNLEISFNETRDMSVNALIDAYCYNGLSQSNKYFVSENVLNAIKLGEVVSTDFIGTYVGQCSNNVAVKNNNFENSVFSGIYIEGAKNVTVDNNNVSLSDIAYSIKTMPRIGINIQSNHISVSGLNYENITGVDKVFLQSNIVKNFNSCISTTGLTKESHRNLVISNNILIANENLSSIVLNNIFQSSITDNFSEGSLFLGSSSDLMISNNLFKNYSNFALYLNNTKKSKIKFFSNSFIVEYGPAIYNNGYFGDSLVIEGGQIDGYMQLGNTFANLQAYNFLTKSNLIKFTSSQVIKLDINEKVQITLPIEGVKRGWNSSSSLLEALKLFRLYKIDLSIRSEVNDNQVNLIIQNIGNVKVDFTAVFLISIESFMSPEFLNYSS